MKRQTFNCDNLLACFKLKYEQKQKLVKTLKNGNYFIPKKWPYFVVKIIFYYFFFFFSFNECLYFLPFMKHFIRSTQKKTFTCTLYVYNTKRKEKNIENREQRNQKEIYKNQVLFGQASKTLWHVRLMCVAILVK